MSIFEGFKSKIPSIVGYTTINHAIRVKMLLTCDQFVLALYLEKLSKAKKLLEEYELYSELGYTAEEARALIQTLVARGYLFPVTKGSPPKFTDKWDNSHGFSKEFEKFWKEKDPEGKERNAWTGSKPMAEKLYNALRKQYSFEYLMKQRDEYFRWLNLRLTHENFRQQRMMATVFLNHQTRRFEEPYSDYCAQIEARIVPKPEKSMASAISFEDVKNKYQ